MTSANTPQPKDGGDAPEAKRGHEASAVLSAARDYVKRGWSPIPVKARGKNPYNPETKSGVGWPDWLFDDTEIERVFAHHGGNIGVILGAGSGGLVDVDLDCEEAIALAPSILPRTGAIFGRDSKPRSHWLYVSTGADTARFNDPDTGDTMVELRSDGAQTVFPGSTHPSGEAVDWDQMGDPADTRAEILQQDVAKLAAAAVLARHWPAPGGHHDAQLTLAAFLTRRRWREEDVSHFLTAVIGAAGGKADPNKRQATARDCAQRFADGRSLRGFPSLSDLFGERVARAIDQWLPGNASAAAGPGIAEEAGAIPELAATEDRLARDFAAEHSEDLRWVDPWGCWMIWDGWRWSKDETLAVLDDVRVFVSARAEAMTRDGDQKQIKLARALCLKRSIEAVEKLARSDRRLAATVAQWDAEPMLLATPEGTIDLTSETTPPPDPSHYLTKATRISPEPGVPTLWLAFLHRITNGDEQLIAFLQRMLGYCLTGSTKEHALFFLYGAGRNGKSVFVNTVAHVLGDYAIAASMDVFTEKKHDNHPEELARLRGARLVTAQETEQGRRWAEARIKQLTGGDVIAARFMRQDSFQFRPVFKLLVAGNHKPSLRSVDEAMRRRIHLIPFTVTIPEDEVDPDLEEKLRAEAPQILNWMLEGCQAWRRERLAPPPTVRQATDDYLHQEDVLGQWLEENCNFNKAAQERSSHLFEDWRTYADAHGERPGSQKAFSQELQKRGLQKVKSAGGLMVFAGIELMRRQGSGAAYG